MNESEIFTLTSNNEQKWDDFVNRFNGASFFHQTGWKHVVEDTYGHKAYYLFTKDETGEINGILPLFFMKSRIFGNKLISLPFSSYGGVCCHDRGTADILLHNALEIAEKLSVNHLEIRDIQNSYARSDFGSMEGYSSFWLDISDIDTIGKNLAPSVKRGIKKATRNKLIFKTNAEKDAYGVFYALYETNMKKFGTPSHSIDFFKNIYETFPQNVSINTVESDEKIIASLFLLYFKESVIAAWGVSLLEYLKYAPNNLMYWNSIRNANKSGYRNFDFGRSIKNSGTFDFKKYWGGQQIPLIYHYYPKNLHLKPPQESYHLYSKIWNAVPNIITRKIGPSLRKYIP